MPRESFLGRGPWRILGVGAFDRGYEKTSDSDPRHLNHNVLVAIDAKRKLNNGHPSFLASLIDQLEIKQGETVYHVGCGTGYYSAIMAEMVGKRGRVIAAEVDQALARRSRQNLKRYAQAEVVAGDGFAHDPGKVDAILVNAGVTHLSRLWLRNLQPGGRLVAPLTLKNQLGRIFKATRRSPTWQARFVSQVASIPAWAAGTRPPRRSWTRHSPAAAPRESARCASTSTSAIATAGCTAGVSASRESSPSAFRR